MKFFYKGIELGFPESVYEPREDSLLIAKVLEEKLEGWKAENGKAKFILEIGCGSGLLSIIAAKSGCEVVASDINSDAVACARKNSELNETTIKIVQSNLFDNISGKFDMIIFNPPYLPEEQNRENKSWAGGNNLEIIKQFIRGAKTHLNADGKILIVISSLSKPEKIIKQLSNSGFNAEIIAEQKIPWEKLFVIRASERK